VYNELVTKRSKGVMPLPNVRDTSLRKYGISPHRFKELYHFCLQYNEWKDELKYKCDTVKSIEVTDMPTAHGNSDQVQGLAIRRAELSEKIKLIEDIAKEADADIYKYILKAVTNEGITYNYLSTVMDIPCGKDMYYDRRRKFYWLLSQKI
jgi:hypothetical protein